MGQFFTRNQNQATSESAPDRQEHATWWCKLLSKVVGVIAGIVGLITGLWQCISVNPLAIVSGLLLMVLSVLVLIFEAPICFLWAEKTKPIAAFAERRTFFQKALIYGIFAIIPIAVYFTLTVLFGAGLIFCCGVIYGLMALGKKADRSQMQENATQMQQQQQAPATQEAPPPYSGLTGIYTGAVAAERLLDNQKNPHP